MIRHFISWLWLKICALLVVRGAAEQIAVPPPAIEPRTIEPPPTVDQTIEPMPPAIEPPAITAKPPPPPLEGPPKPKALRKRRTFQPPIPEDIKQQLPRPVAQPRPKREHPTKRTSRQHSNAITKTLADLLDGIEKTFEDVTAPILQSDIDSEARRGFRRLGPHVMPNSGPRDIDDWPTHLSEKKGRSFSTMIFVGFPKHPDIEGLDEELKELYYGCFFYATKIKSCPWNCEHREGVIYHCGVGWRGYTGAKKVHWSEFYVSVAADGSVYVLAQRIFERIAIAPKGVCVGKYERKSWGVPLIWGQDHWGADDIRRKESLVRWFVYGFESWEARDQMWTVSVRRSNLRATFCIDPKETREYFRDREKTTLTPTGRRKMIIHYVAEHDRVVGERTIKIKEHLRGERIFDWRGYHCAVTSPKLHVFSLYTADFASENLEDDKLPSKDWLYASDVGGMIANLEDEENIKVSDWSKGRRLNLARAKGKQDAS